MRAVSLIICGSELPLLGRRAGTLGPGVEDSFFHVHSCTSLFGGFNLEPVQRGILELHPRQAQHVAANFWRKESQATFPKQKSQQDLSS